MRVVLAFVFVLTCLASVPALAAGPSAPPDPTLTDPVWTAGPTGQDLKQFYPAGALSGGISGFAVVTCTVGRNGELGGCAIFGEQPKDHGFGPALLQIAGYMRMAPTSAGGAPTAGREIRLGASFTARTIAGVDDQTVQVVTVRR